VPEISSPYFAELASLTVRLAVAPAELSRLAAGPLVLLAVGAQPQLHDDTARLRLEGNRDAMGRAGLAAPRGAGRPVDRLHRPDGAAAMTRLLDGSHPVATPSPR
jgi:hypothetical protein